MQNNKLVILVLILFFANTFFLSATLAFEDFESIEDHNNKNNFNKRFIVMLAFPTEFYEYESNYTFMCPGRGYGLWITPEGIYYNTLCGAILYKDKFYGIANSIIVLGVKVIDINYDNV